MGYLISQRLLGQGLEARFIEDGYDYGDKYDSDDSEQIPYYLYDQPSFIGWTPLHFAAYDGHLHLLQALLDCGVAVGTEDEHGKTPLHLASSRGYHLIIQALISKGAKVDATISPGGDTPLMIAAMHGHLQAVQTLLDTGATVSMKNGDITALSRAAVFGHSSIVEALLSAGASPQDLTEEQRWLVQNKGHTEVLKKLGQLAITEDKSS